MEEAQRDHPMPIGGCHKQNDDDNDNDEDNSIDSTSSPQLQEPTAPVSVRDDNSVDSSSRPYHQSGGANYGDGNENENSSDLIGSWMVPTRTPFSPDTSNRPMEIAFVPSGDGEIPPVVVEPKDGSFRGERKLPKLGDLLQDIPFVPPGVDERATVVAPKDGSYRGERKLEQLIDPEDPLLCVPQDGNSDGGSLPSVSRDSTDSFNVGSNVDREGFQRNQNANRDIDFVPCESELQANETDSGHVPIDSIPEDAGITILTAVSPKRGSFLGNLDGPSPTPPRKTISYKTREREINFSPGASTMQTAAPPKRGSFVEDRSRISRTSPQHEINVLPEVMGKAMPTSPPPQHGSFRGQINRMDSHDDYHDDGGIPVETSTEPPYREQPKADSEDDDEDDIAGDNPMAEDQDLWRWKKRWDSARQKQTESTSPIHEASSSPLSTGDTVLASSVQMLGSLMASSYQEEEIQAVDSQDEANGLSQSIQKLGSLLGSWHAESGDDKRDLENSEEDQLLDELLGDDELNGPLTADQPLVNSIDEPLSTIKGISAGKKITEDDVTVVMGNTTPKGGRESKVSTEEIPKRPRPRKEALSKVRRAKDAAVKAFDTEPKKPSRKPSVPKFRGQKNGSTEPAVPVKLQRKPAVPRFRSASGIDSFMASTPSAQKRGVPGRTKSMLTRFTGWTPRGVVRKEKSMVATSLGQDGPSDITKRLFQKYNGAKGGNYSLSVGNVSSTPSPNTDRPKAHESSRFEIIGRPASRHHPEFYALSPLGTHSSASLSSYCSVSDFKSPRRDGSKGCQNSFEPYLHPHRGPCELCVFFLSDKERAQLDATGRHVSVMFTTGGCCRSCEVFPRSFDDQPARLCRMCYQNSHRKVHQLYTSKWSRRVKRAPPLSIPELGEQY